MIRTSEVDSRQDHGHLNLHKNKDGAAMVMNTLALRQRGIYSGSELMWWSLSMTTLHFSLSVFPQEQRWRRSGVGYIRAVKMRQSFDIGTGVSAVQKVSN